MSRESRFLAQEDPRVRGLLLALGLVLLLDGALRLFPEGVGDGAEALNASAPQLALRTPSQESRDRLLALLSPPTPEPEKSSEEDSPEVPTVKEDEQEGRLGELFVDRHRFRLRACFTTMGRAAFAAIERVDADSGAQSMERLQLEDSLGPYKVDSIGQRSVTLRARDGREIELRLFEANPENKTG
jgi:hypothetical protein